MFNNIKKGRYSFPSPFWDDISADAKDLISVGSVAISQFPSCSGSLFLVTTVHMRAETPGSN